MANTQDIEARLCAYIDGQLDAQERADIEQHLATHPEHRLLLEELARHRDLLRRLPRESAPEDLYESFTAQLERSVLLDPAPREHLAGDGHPNRWPQIYAVAAVLLLAFGLGAVIYFVLPRHSLEESNFAIAPATTTQPLNLSTRGATQPERSLAMNTHSTALPAMESSRRHGEAANELFSRSNAKAVEIAPMLPGQTSDLFAGGQSESSSRLAGQAQSGPVVLVVNAPDPAAAQSQVTHFLGENKISWQMVDQSQTHLIALRDCPKCPDGSSPAH